MLSILIPTFNYNLFSLVNELNQQCQKLQIEYEIICQDDASISETNIENEKINEIPNCFFTSNLKNLGRGENRNSLARKAKFEFLLFLDCDTFPTNSNFIEKYSTTIYTSDVVYGGLKYKSEKPNQLQLLRWVYGKKREAISVIKRIKNPYKKALTSNFLIKKNVFLSTLFDNAIKDYGYEDYLFFFNLKQKKVKITHIDNPVFHLGLDTSEVFLEKTKTASQNLVFLNKMYPLLFIDNKIIKTFKNLEKLKLLGFFRYFFKLLEPKIKNNLVSKTPSLFIFDIYKLGCFTQKTEN